MPRSAAACETTRWKRREGAEAAYDALRRLAASPDTLVTANALERLLDQLRRSPSGETP